MPERCPTCDSLLVTRPLLRPVSGTASEHRRRKIEYRFSALDGGYEEVCSDCEELLRGAGEPPGKDTASTEVVVKT